MPAPALDSSAQMVIADARNKADVRQALAGCDVVVNAIGAGTLRRNEVESTTTAVAVAASQEARVERYFAMSAGMVALDWILFKYVLRPLIFRHILAEHCRVEEIVKGSSLAWTIVRPSKLTNGAPKGYVATLQLQPKSFSTTRADVASFIADEIDARAYVRQAVFVTSRVAR
jgi:putative NADH-flavin reductase